MDYYLDVGGELLVWPLRSEDVKPKAVETEVKCRRCKSGLLGFWPPEHKVLNLHRRGNLKNRQSATDSEWKKGIDTPQEPNWTGKYKR
jgi:hypothetical protein